VPVTILVAEDSVTMRHIMEMTFAGENAKVTTVDSGEAAVAKASELQPDVIIADLSMRGMDGYAVAREIKSKPALAKTAVIVMASQKGPYDESKGKASGVDDHIVKPFDTQLVIDKVKQVLGKPRTTVAAGAPAPVRAPTVLKGVPQPVAASSAAATPAAQGAKPKPAIPPAGVPGPMTARKATQIGAPPPAIAEKLAEAAAAPAHVHVPPPATSSAGLPSPAIAPTTAAGAPAIVMPPAAQASLDSKLRATGLKPEQVEAVLQISREIIEQVVWEVVPDLAESIIREEIKRLTSA
jgi:CheY-like chemotaxis protein